MTEKRQNDGWGRHQDDDSRAVIPDLIRNLCYCQKTQILTFVRMTVREIRMTVMGSIRMTIAVPSFRT
jgi:hypothetical protein